MSVMGSLSAIRGTPNVAREVSATDGPGKLFGWQAPHRIASLLAAACLAR